MQNEKFKQLLKTNRLSNTKSRNLVFKALSSVEYPLSMKELLELCPKVDRVSVYRIIDIFERIGIVHRLQTGWKYKIELGENFNHHHHHITCTNCGIIQEIAEHLILIPPSQISPQITSLS